MSNQRWSMPINPNASLVSRLYCLLEALHDASDVLKAWPAEDGAQEVRTPLLCLSYLYNSFNQNLFYPT